MHHLLVYVNLLVPVSSGEVCENCVIRIDLVRLVLVDDDVLIVAKPSSVRKNKNDYGFD